MAQNDRREAKAVAGEALVWLLFFALLFPAGLAGWAIGRATAGGKRTVTRTVTVAAATTAPTTTAATTTAAAATTKTTPTKTTPTKTTPAKTTPAKAGANPAQGKAVFLASGCGACHTFKPAGASATIGPDLDAKPALDAKKAKQPLAAFIEESIVKPDAYISPGYPKGVMPKTFGAQLTKKQLADLVAFIAAGK